MAWNDKYWDIIDQLYWWPRYLGLRSINRRHWQTEGDRISIPASLVNKSGPLYTRRLKVGELMEDLRGKEEILNHVFDLTFAIAPDALIQRAFLTPFSFSDSSTFQSIGREVQLRYGWGQHDNVTQQDGLFVSDRSIVGVELKLGSSSWPIQILKYAALFAWEEMHSGPREHVGLLYIVPENALSTHWKSCGLKGPDINASFLDSFSGTDLPAYLAKFLAENRHQLATLLDRLQLAAISWKDFRSSLCTFRDDQDVRTPGGQTLCRLVNGLVAQIDVHKGVGIESELSTLRSNTFS